MDKDSSNTNPSTKNSSSESSISESSGKDSDNLSIESIHAFSLALRNSPELARQVRYSSNPQQIVEIAKSLNIDINIPLLRRFSSQLTASYWPWENQVSEMRRKFFDG